MLTLQDLKFLSVELDLEEAEVSDRRYADVRTRQGDQPAGLEVARALTGWRP